jgi:hypothetical protein
MNIGRTKHSSLVVRRDTRHQAAQNWQSAVTNDDNSTSIVHSVKKLTKETKNLKKAFTQLQKTSK